MPTPHEVLDLIARRRSVRSFTGEPVPREALESMLAAAMSAPSARDGQPWRFLVITDPGRVAEVCRAHPHAGFGARAGAVVVPFHDGPEGFYPNQDLAAAVENLLLAAANLGYGATWCGMTRERQPLLRPVTGLPEPVWIFAVIPIGVPAGPVEPRLRYDPAKVYWERYPDGR